MWRVEILGTPSCFVGFTLAVICSYLLSFYLSSVHSQVRVVSGIAGGDAVFILRKDDLHILLSRKKCGLISRYE